MAAKNAYVAVAKDPSKVGGVNINIDVGVSSSSQTSSGQSSTASGAAVSAGRDLTIIAGGKGDQSDIIVSGSDLAAGRNIVLDAQGDILLTAQQNTASQKTDGKSSSASIGVGFSIGGTQDLENPSWPRLWTRVGSRKQSFACFRACGAEPGQDDA
ncbi:MAG: hemagglutinin repeat-containing protein [Achromobacter sp.]|uniref:hemagglutinin repeat-containing protein n=1 Tax=Achromobacter sp. TaxID=134375 RepID=UPI003CFE1639